MIVEKISVSANITLQRQLAAVADAQGVRFDATGGQMLFLEGSSPPMLWAANVTQAGLTQRRRLIFNSQLDTAGWKPPTSARAGTHGKLSSLLFGRHSGTLDQAAARRRIRK